MTIKIIDMKSRMKKLVFITILSVALGPMLLAQSAGIKGGLNFSSLSSDGNDDENLKVGYHVGVFSTIPLSTSFALQPELLYSNKGMKMNYDESAIANGETKFNLNYIDLPVKLVFKLTENFDVQFGPYVSYLINANTKTDADVLGFFDIDSEDELDRDRFNAIDYGLSTGVGFDLGGLVFGANYNFGLKPVAKEGDPAYNLLGDKKNQVVQLYIGLKI